jgi:hypothetical protein
VNDFRWGARAGDEETGSSSSTKGSSTSTKQGGEEPVPEVPPWVIPAGLPGGPQSASHEHPCPTPVLTHNLQLYSAAGFPPYTNFTGGFKDLLDYIYVEKDRFEVTRVAPFPSLEQLVENVALPSEVFPSDHIAVAVDLKLK